MNPLPEIQSWRQDVNPEEAEGEVRWLQELIDEADEAIAAQRRIIAHDGQLEAHKLSLSSLEQRQKQLEGRLAALMAQRQTEVLDFALAGPKYSGFRARADVLAGFLHAMQQLYLRIGQSMAMTKPGPVVPLHVSSICQLEVAGFFPSSFGVRFAAPTRADLVGHSLTTTALTATFDLVNAEDPIEQLAHVGHFAMAKYTHLVKTLVKAEAVPKVNWHTPTGSERAWQIDEQRLLILHNRLCKIHHEEPRTIESTGTLTGASLRRHRFEFTSDRGVITGTAPHELAPKITDHFGKPCRITYSETRYIDETTDQEKRSRVLIDISKND